MFKSHPEGKDLSGKPLAWRQLSLSRQSLKAIGFGWIQGGLDLQLFLWAMY